MSYHSILLVDPFKNLVNAYQIILRDEGYSVNSALNLEEAYSLVKKEEYSIIIIEYIYPHEATEGFIRKIKEDFPATYILMVANATIDESTYERLFMVGVDEFILKPYSPDKIIVHIKKGLKQRDLILRLKVLEKLSLLDPISERISNLIFNRNFFERFLRQEIKRSKRHNHNVSLLLIKVSNKEKEKESHFDNFLREFLELLRKNTREEDFICKSNGEVSIILPETNKDGCNALLNRINKLIETYSIFQRDKALGKFIKTLSFQSYTFPEQSKILESLKF
jgi:diguanylate cyclase (GGDEF)-like protein